MGSFFESQEAAKATRKKRRADNKAAAAARLQEQIMTPGRPSTVESTTV